MGMCDYPKLLSLADESKAAQYGVDHDLVRISVGLEASDDLQERFQKALVAAASINIETISKT